MRPVDSTSSPRVLSAIRDACRDTTLPTRSAHDQQMHKRAVRIAPRYLSPVQGLEVALGGVVFAEAFKLLGGNAVLPLRSAEYKRVCIRATAFEIPRCAAVSLFRWKSCLIKSEPHLLMPRLLALVNSTRCCTSGNGGNSASMSAKAFGMVSPSRNKILYAFLKAACA